MTIEEYCRNQEARRLAEPPRRPRCLRCRRPETGCFCGQIKAFAPEMQFALLIHKEEARRGIATGRMTHLCLANSVLLEGIDYTNDERVNALIADPANYPVLLYPGRGATDISSLPDSVRGSFAPEGKRLVIFLLDGTWATARKMRRLSANLQQLPMICFTPRTPSRFAVRRQPAARCYSTIESVHEVIDLLSPGSETRPHDNLLEVFAYLVQQQLSFRSEVSARRFFRRVQGKGNNPRKGVRQTRRIVT